MAQTAHSDNKGTAGMAQGGELYNEQVDWRDSPGVNRRRNLTPETKQRIRELYAETGSGHEVARRLGIGRTTVYNHLRLSRNKKPRWTDDEDQIVVDGYVKKQRTKDIAAKIGRSRGAVAVHMCRHRKKIREDPKKRHVMGVMTKVLKIMREADIFREVED